MRPSSLVPLIAAALPAFGCGERPTATDRPETRPAAVDDGLPDRFFAFLGRAGDDPARKVEHREIVERLCRAVKEEGRRNPAAVEPLLEELVPAAARSSPGFALLVSAYADDAVRDEMARLRRESAVEKLTEKESRIAELEKQVGALEQEVLKLKKECEWGRKAQTPAPWWDLPGEPRTLLDKGVKLCPGQASEVLNLSMKEGIYDIRSPEGARFRLWINGDEIELVADGKKFQGPPLQDFARLKVQLSPLMADSCLIEFLVVRADRGR